MYIGVIFWIESKKNKISQSKNKEIEIIHKWKGGTPNLIIKAMMKIKVLELNWEKNKDL